MRIGHQMEAVRFLVSQDPGAVMYSIAKRVHHAAASGKNNALGYNPIHRAHAAGLVCMYRDPYRKGSWRLITPEHRNALQTLTRVLRTLGGV